MRNLRARIRRIVQGLKNAWRPPCIGCGGNSMLCHDCAKEANPRHFNLQDARLCMECDAVFEACFAHCPACGDSHWRPVGFFYQDSVRGQKARNHMRLIKNSSKT